ncbi:MAG TPA: cupredoxin domain-containing protein, partial [Actinomycetota bacterium]
MADVVVVLGALGLIGGLTWFFFGPKEAGKAVEQDGVQEIEVMVKGGYSPSHIRVRQGVPLRITFDRQEAGECTSRVVFPDFATSKVLPAYARTVVELTPDRAGEFGFACGMNMVHGTLIVEPAEGNGKAAGGNGEGARPDAVIPLGDLTPKPAESQHTHEDAGRVTIGRPTGEGERKHLELYVRGSGKICPTCVNTVERVLAPLPGVERASSNVATERVTVDFDPRRITVDDLRGAVAGVGYRIEEREHPGTPQEEDQEAAGRRAEIRDLSWRVALGALLTAPVLVAAMAHDLFEA